MLYYFICQLSHTTIILSTSMHLFVGDMQRFLHARNTSGADIESILGEARYGKHLAQGHVI